MPQEEVGPALLPLRLATGTDSEYGAAAGQLHLVRLESADWFAEAAGFAPDELVLLIQEFIDDPSPRNRVLMLSILDAVAARSEIRPTFAAFLNDVRYVADASVSDDDATSMLRDHLGLAHYDPGAVGKVPVIVFRYPIADLPVRRDADLVVAAPTVIDSTFNGAFCPSPRESRLGSAVDLQGARAAPCRELLHIPFRYRPEHIVRVGAIGRETTVTLERARAHHIVRLRELLSRPDYADETDGDIVHG